MGIRIAQISVIFLACLNSTSLFSQDLFKKDRKDSISCFFHTASFKNILKDEVEQRLKKDDFLKYELIILKAYTDTTGSKESNIRLGSKRLLSTLTALRNLGYKGQIDTLNFGGTIPKRYRNDSLNRRVDILVYDIKYIFDFDKAIPLQLNFDGGSTNLIGGFDKVEGLKQILLSNKEISIELNGHVCCHNNTELSLKRAEAIKKILVRSGVASDRITCKGLGNTDPLKKEISELDRVANRRVEVVFHLNKE